MLHSALIIFQDVKHMGERAGHKVCIALFCTMFTVFVRYIFHSR